MIENGKIAAEKLNVNWKGVLNLVWAELI